MLKQKDPTNSFWSEVELISYVNEAIRLYFLECTINNEGYFTTTTDLAIVSGSETVALPTDCFEVKNLWKSVTNGYILLPYKNSLTDSYSTQSGGGTDSYLPSYYFRGNNLVLRDTPNFSQTAGLKLEYIQFPDTMIYGGDSMTNQVSPIFKQLIVMYAVYKAKLSESLANNVNLYAAAKQNVDELYTIFKDTISNRSKNPTFVTPFNPETESY
jgi:hypothetical protein